MLAEALLYLATPCSRSARRIGHLNASIDLWSRAGRCRRAWTPHERRCHQVIERAIGELAMHRKVLVLGSGLLRDVPLPLLADRFDEVMLVDVVHPLAARLAALGRRNVRFLQADLSGTTGLILGGQPLVEDPLSPFRAEPGLDLVISANLLSQLPLSPLAALEDRLKPAELDALAARIVRGHVEGLLGFAGRVVLLTDTEMRRVGRGGRVEERLDLMRGLSLPPPTDAWDWTLAPEGEDGPDHALIHAARGYADFRRAAAQSGTFVKML